MDGIHAKRQRGTWADEKNGNQPDGRPNAEKKCSPIIVVRLADKKSHSPINILKRSIRRAWTINGPFDYWGIARTSTSTTIYRSLPLRRKTVSTVQCDESVEQENQNNDNVSQLCNSDVKTRDTVIKSSVLKRKSTTTDIVDKLNTERTTAQRNLRLTTTRTLEKFTSPTEAKSLIPKYVEKKSNIPIFRRNSREYEDISPLRVTSKRSTLIPSWSQRSHRGSADDLRRYRDDSLPSLIPKLSTPQRDKESKIKKFTTIDSRLTSSCSYKKDVVRDDLKFQQKFSRREITKIKMPSKEQQLKDDSTVEEMNDDDDDKMVDEKEDTKMSEDESIKIHEDPIDVNFDLANSQEIAKNFDDTTEKKTEITTSQQRKISKEEYFGTDDTDDATPNRRWSSHLSPEASPLSTRSSKYSPRESESEPTPALPRKTATSSGESCISSQRIRDAITRTRRESNSSARYESSGSESIRLSESGLHDYVDLARRVRMIGNNYYCPRASVESDEPIQRDSATSAGEDETHQDCLVRDPSRYTGASSQGRTILRRRRQFDSQGSRRRARSHARSCCSDELPNLQISRQHSPRTAVHHGQESPNPDYRRLVFISSDSSSGREEDDADSSCSSSSYLNGLPRNSHAQNLEDCDWDYFESDTLPLPSALSDSLKFNNISAHIKDHRGRAWDCCLGGGSGACLACGGSPGQNVLPVPVPIPVPVLYPVPVPASLWNNGNFAAASSMITNSADAVRFTGVEQSLTGPWFSWNPKFLQSDILNATTDAAGAAASAAVAAANFDPASILTFRPNEILLGQYGMINNHHNNLVVSSFINTCNTNDSKSNNVDTAENTIKIAECKKNSAQCAGESLENIDAPLTMSANDELNDDKTENFSHSNSESSSSGRSSADSSDLEESSSSSPRFSRIFVVNDDELTDNQHQDDDENQHEIIPCRENGIVLKSITTLSDDEPVILQSVKSFDADELTDTTHTNPQTGEIYIPNSIDYTDCHVELKSIRQINPEYQTESPDYNEKLNIHDADNEVVAIEKSDDTSIIIPDSLEIDTTVDSKNSTLNSTITSTESENTGSEFSSDELHEYQLSPHNSQLLKDVNSDDGKNSDNKLNELTATVISTRIHELFNEVDDRNLPDVVRGEKSQVRSVGEKNDSAASYSGVRGKQTGGEETAVGTSRFRSVERRPPTRKENAFQFNTTSATITSNEHHHLHLQHQHHTTNNNLTSNNKYKSLVMITQGSYQPVSVITSDTTTLLQPPDDTRASSQGLAGYYHLALEAATDEPQQPRKGSRPLMVKRLTTLQAEHETDSGFSVGSASESDDVQHIKKSIDSNKISGSKNTTKMTVDDEIVDSEGKTVLPTTIGGVAILEEGLADDDSWVEEVSHDEDEQSGTTATEESSEDEANCHLGDREEELRGYHRQAIDFTLHTIVEESCEESEAEPSIGHRGWKKKQRPPSASELEKYFFFGLGGDTSTNSVSNTANINGNVNQGINELDSLSETSSVYSEGLESLGQDDIGLMKEKGTDFSNSSRLEKYFLSEFLGFDQDRRDSDGSVGSDSEGRPSPEAQRRKRLVRARGTGRSHSSSLDNLLALTQSSQNLSSQNSLQDLSMTQDSQDTQSGDSSTETDGLEDGQSAPFGVDGQFDTVKRKKKKPRNLGSQSPRVPEDRNKSPELRESFVKSSEVNDTETNNSEEDRLKTPEPEVTSSSPTAAAAAAVAAATSVITDSDNAAKQQSRDSGFIGSCDDLLQHQKSTTVDSKSDVTSKDHSIGRNRGINDPIKEETTSSNEQQHAHNTGVPFNASLSRKDSFNNWSSDEETNLMMSKMRQFFKTMVANSNGQTPSHGSHSSGPSPLPSPRLSGYTSAKSRITTQNRTKPPQLVYFENELTRLMKTVPGIRDEQVREIVEYLSSEDTWSDSYDSSDYTSSDLEGAAGGRRSALQEQISQSCQQIIDKFDITSDTLNTEKVNEAVHKEEESVPPGHVGRDTALVYQKLVQSFTKMASDSSHVSSDTNSTPHSSPPLIAKVMHHIGSRLVALMHQVSEGNSTVTPHPTWRRYSQHHRTPSSASTTEDDDSTSDSAHTPTPSHSQFQLPRSKSHDPLLLINGHPTTTTGPEGEEREASDYERFSWRGSFESALMAADSRTKLSLLTCSGDVNASSSANALAMAAKRRSAGDLLFNPKSFSREQLDRVRSCGSIGGANGPISVGSTGGVAGSIEEKIWSNRRRSSVPDANTRESGASAGDDDTEDEMEYNGDPRATTLPRGMQATTAATAATNSLPRLPMSSGVTSTTTSSTSSMHKAHSMYHFLPQHTGVKSARYRPPGFARNSNNGGGGGSGPKRAFSAPGLEIAGAAGGHIGTGKTREVSRTRRRQQAISLMPDDGSSLSEACSTPIIGGTSPRLTAHRGINHGDDLGEHTLNSGHHAVNTRASLSSLGARSDSMASVYSGAGEGRWCGSVAVRGQVEFSLQYDYKQLTFQVHISQCRDLAPVDSKRNRSDPYVKVYLLPDKSKGGKRKTKVKKHTLNPVFDETLKFHMSLNGLETRTLWLTVWHSDMFGRNDFLGEVRMPLENKIFDDPTPRWYTLEERTEPFDDPISCKGEVIVGLKFVPPDAVQLERERELSANDNRGLSKSKKNSCRGALHVLVKEARNLQTRAKNSGTCDPFCKSYLLPDKGRAGKQKTNVVRRCGGSPVWNHTFVYKDVSLEELAERGLELTVWDHDRIASNEFLGGVRFNLGTGKNYGKSVDWMDATGRELSLWQSMLERPNFWVEGAVTLRPNLHNHGKNSAF